MSPSRPVRIVVITCLLVTTALLAACGGSDNVSSGSAVEDASYSSLNSAATQLKVAATESSANLKTCLNAAAGECGQISCLKLSISGTVAAWGPVGAVVGTLISIDDGECKSQIQAARDQLTLLSGADGVTIPSNFAQLKALPNTMFQQIDAFEQAVQGAKSVCLPAA